VSTFAVDARAAAEVPAGRGRYVRELLGALAAADGEERWLLLCREPAPLSLDERFTWRSIDAPDPLWHLLAARQANRHADALLSTNSYLTAWFTRVPIAVVVHDMVSFVEPAWAQRRAGRIERATLGIAVRRASAFACDSEATRRDLVARFPATAGRAEAIPLATAASFAPPAMPPARPVRPFVLAVGTLEPRKNLTRLIDAWTALPAAVRGEHELLLVGPTGWQAEQILARADAAGVRMAGYVNDEELVALYASCTAFV
jgi:glycosyltransferase involved in cell wall biosynthesis